MIRNLKALGLALVAVLAMSAVAASGASATGQVTAPEGYPVSLKGEQLGANVLSIAGGVRTVSCGTANLTAELPAGPQTEVTVVPSYENCTGNGETTATIKMTSCDYILVNTTVSGDTGTGHVVLRCDSPTDELHIEIWEKAKEHTEANLLCRYTIGSQQLTGNFEWHIRNKATTTEDIELTFNNLGVDNITVTNAKNAILCGKAAGTKTTGVYNGNITVTGFSGLNHRKVMIG